MITQWNILYRFLFFHFINQKNNMAKINKPTNIYSRLIYVYSTPVLGHT
uniref:Uncharacterized protein n=1 Tax=Setaria italica TaxID=4555 RepID=K3ZGK1_SETIT